MTLAAIVLAAGAGTRFGGGKLAAPFRGEPLIAHAIRAARAAPVDRVIVVCAPDLAIGDWPGAPPVAACPIASPALSASLAAGIAAVGDAEGAFIFLGDMPLIPSEVAHALVAAWNAAARAPFAAAPRHQGRIGHPVLFGRRAFAALAALDGDRGAGQLLRDRDDIACVDWPTDAIHHDIDRREDLAQLEKREQP